MSIDEMTRHLFKKLLKLLFHPFQFFEGMQETPRLLPPFLLVLGICLAQSVWYSRALVASTEQLLGGAGIFPTKGYALWLMMQLTIGPAVHWIVFTGIIFVVSALFRGQGSFSRLLACTAYGVLIGYMMSLIQAIFGILAGQRIMNEASRLMMDNGYLSLPNPGADPLIGVFGMVFWFIGTIGFLWTFIVNVAATRYGRYIPRTHALLTVILALACMYGVVLIQALFVRYMVV